MPTPCLDQILASAIELSSSSTSPAVSVANVIGPLPLLDVPTLVSSLKSAGLSPEQLASALASALGTYRDQFQSYERIVHDYRCITVGPPESPVPSAVSSSAVSVSSSPGVVSASPRRSRSFRRNARRRSAASSASSSSSKNLGAVFAGGTRFPSIVPSEVGTKPYFEPFSDAMPRHVRGYQSGNSFGIYPTSSRGSSGSPSQIAPPDGKCYLRIIAGGHRTSARELFSDYPLVTQVLAAPAVMFSVDALYTVRAMCDSLDSIHASSQGDHTIYAILARFALIHKRNLSLSSSKWDGSLLQALVARSDFAVVSRECNYLYTFDAVLGGTERGGVSFASPSGVSSFTSFSSTPVQSSVLPSSPALRVCVPTVAGCELLPSGFSRLLFDCPDALPRGFCYLRLLRTVGARSIGETLGPWPTVASLLMLSATSFKPLQDLRVFRFVGDSGVVHVERSGAGAPVLPLLARVARGLQLPSGTFGAFLCASVVQSDACVFRVAAATAVGGQSLSSSRSSVSFVPARRVVVPPSACAVRLCYYGPNVRVESIRKVYSRNQVMPDGYACLPLRGGNFVVYFHASSSVHLAPGSEISEFERFATKFWGDVSILFFEKCVCEVPI